MSKIGQIFPKKISEEYLIRRPTYKLILRSLTRLLIILVSLTRSLFSEKMLISNRCISALMPKLIKKSWTVSTKYVPHSICVRFSQLQWMLQKFHVTRSFDTSFDLWLWRTGRFKRCRVKSTIKMRNCFYYIK